MTVQTDMHRGLLLRGYLALSHLFPLVAKPMLRRRLKRGKEHPTRWVEKLGHGLTSRPKGTLVWLHAVGLGEVLSLRGLITRMATLQPELHFLVTSSTAASAQVFAKNAPRNTIHQFLPLDAPTYRKRFLDHFAPDLCVWAEQDLWPGTVSDLAARGIPQCIVAARMNAKSHRSHERAASVFHDLYGAMQIVTAQDEATAAHLETLGAQVRISGSLKPAAPQLSCDADALDAMQAALDGRTVWAVAPAHPADIQIARAAHERLCASDPSALLIIAPRFPGATMDEKGPRKSQDQQPGPEEAIWLCDTFGDLGLVYRLAKAVLIGGTFTAVEGHNPWEAAALGCAILHGPRTANFAADYAQLATVSGAIQVQSADDVVQALMSDTLGATAQRATSAIATASAQTDALAADLLKLLEVQDAR